MHHHFWFYTTLRIKPKALCMLGYAFYKLSYIPGMELVLRSSLELSAWISVTMNCDNAERSTQSVLPTT